MQRKNIILGIVVIAVLAAAGYATLRFIGARSAQTCRSCLRPVHSHMKTVALVGGKRAMYCCPACALAEHQQSGQTVQVTELTDYLTNTPLKPDGSYIVRDSDVNPCMQHHPALSENGQPLEEHFDRCSPSVLAFASRAVAEEFSRNHGGKVFSFTDFAAEFGR